MDILPDENDVPEWGPIYMHLREVVEKELARLNSANVEEFFNPDDWYVLEGAKNALNWVLEQMDEK